MAVRLSASCTGRPLTPGRFLVLISVRGWVDPRAIVRLEGLGQLKHSTTSSGIKPATFRLLAECLNHKRAPNYCRVLPGNATNNLWVLDLTLGLLEYSPGGTTVSRFTILQHINFTVESSVGRLLRSPLNWFLLSTDPSLSLSSVSHPLKLILCRLEREHLLEHFSFLFPDATTGSIFVTAESHC
jgi:hypothetical protein